MRDHFYQLFDLEKNFGEKILCGEPVGRLDPYGDLGNALGLRKDRGLVKLKEKPTGPEL